MPQNSYRIKTRSKDRQINGNNTSLLQQFSSCSPIPHYRNNVISMVEFPSASVEKKIIPHKRQSQTEVRKGCESSLFHKIDKENINAFVKRQALKSERKKLMKIIFLNQHEEFRKNRMQNHLTARRQACLENGLIISKTRRGKHRSLKSDGFPPQQNIGNQQLALEDITQTSNTLDPDSPKKCINQSNNQNSHLRKTSLFLSNSSKENNGYKGQQRDCERKFQISRWDGRSIEFPDVFSSQVI